MCEGKRGLPILARRAGARCRWSGTDRRPGVERPAIAVNSYGVRPSAPSAKLEALAKPADSIRRHDRDKAQYERFEELPCWATDNFAELRLDRRT